jgi:hypothetical protein
MWPSELKRQRDRAEWLGPLEVLVGTSAEDRTDRFVGRRHELKALTNFAETLRPRSVGEMETQLLRRVGGAPSSNPGANAMKLIAPCGMGKSALIAKFALDHAVKSAIPFPFIYFDCRKLSPQSCCSIDLLCGATWQLSLQFPDHTNSLTALGEEVRDWLAKSEDASACLKNSGDNRGQRTFEAFFLSFRSYLEATSGWSDRTLIVFDALDAVQASTDTMAGVKEFLRLLCAGGFPQLRILLAGRSDPKELLDLPWLNTAKRPLTLGPLSMVDTREMVNKLGDRLLQEEWQPVWAREIAGRSNTRPDRREPLSLQRGVEFICSVSKERRDEAVRDYVRSSIGGSPGFSLLWKC